MNKPNKLWEQSVKKWERIVRVAEKEELTPKMLDGDRGFCEEYHSIVMYGTTCGKCPLLEEGVCSYITTGKTTFWQINNELKFRKKPNWKKVQKWCEKVLEAVKRNRF